MASPPPYTGEDATVVDVNKRIHLLTSCVKDFNVTYTTLKSLNINSSEWFEDAHEVRELLTPPRPVMIAVITPVVKPGRDAFLREDGVELTS